MTDNEAMKPIEILGPNKDVLEFFRQYMTGVKNLNGDERKLYLRYMQDLTMMKYIVDESKINLKDLVEGGNRPGAIIRRRP